MWKFYPKLIWEIARKIKFMTRYWLELDRMRRSVQDDPDRQRYTDAALAPVVDEETETLEIFTHNEGARNEVVRTRRIAELTGGAGKSPAEA